MKASKKAEIKGGEKNFDVQTPGNVLQKNLEVTKFICFYPEYRTADLNSGKENYCF